ncbi:MAG TPA: hypothetical protein P5267_01695, partial [Patescibacteria group bacterium]|nr:hypothetical protein [Patescibacteria group bacterium]
MGREAKHIRPQQPEHPGAEQASGVPLAERNGQRQQEIVPPEVDNNKSNWRVTLVSGAKEIYSSLKQDSKDMLSAAMEKIGQSERVQNATD